MGTFEWLKGDGTAQIQTIIEEHPQIGDWNIISIHGTSMVTMPDIAVQYIDNYEKWINDTFSRYHVYMVSIPPLDEKAWKEKHPDVPRDNESIKAFNKQIKEAFPENYFDYYDWFLEHDDFQDEIHYTGKTYCMPVSYTHLDVYKRQGGGPLFHYESGCLYRSKSDWLLSYPGGLQTFL